MTPANAFVRRPCERSPGFFPGPRTEPGKAIVAQNGRTRQKGPLAVRQARASLSDLNGMVAQMVELRRSILGQLVDSSHSSKEGASTSSCQIRAAGTSIDANYRLRPQKLRWQLFLRRLKLPADIASLESKREGGTGSSNWWPAREFIGSGSGLRFWKSWMVRDVEHQ